MSSLPKCRKIKRPSLLAKRSQLAIKIRDKKRSYKPLCQKLKTNNQELAKRLSKVEPMYQDLVSLSIMLSGQLLDMSVACNKRDDIISGVLKDAEESQQHLLAVSDHLSNIITSCQQVVKRTVAPPRKFASAIERESTGRLSGQPPARVVEGSDSQNITNLTMLSRLNMQREYDRVANSPNLSNIDEVFTTPEQSISTMHQSTTPPRLSIARPLDLNIEKLPGTPSRLYENDVDEHRSSIRSKRNFGRHSGCLLSCERQSPNVALARSSDSAMVHGKRDPTMILHDFSQLPNSQSHNIETSLDNSSHMDWTQSDQHELIKLIEAGPITHREESPNRMTFQDFSATPETIRSLNVSKIDKFQNKNEDNSSHNDKDPVERASWSTDASSSNQHAGDTIHKIIQALSPVERNSVGNDNDDGDDNTEDSSFTRRWAEHVENFERKLNAIGERTRTEDINFVSRRRSYSINPYSFSLLDLSMDNPFIGMSTATILERRYDFTMDDLVMPVLDSTIAPPEEVCPPESDDPHDRCQRIIPVNPNSSRATSIEQDESDSLSCKRKRLYTRNKIINSISVSEPHNDEQRNFPSRKNSISRTTSGQQDEQSAHVSGRCKRKKSYKRIKICNSSSDSESDN